MLGYILKRLLLAVPTLFAVLSLVFVLARVLPGDPAPTILGVPLGVWSAMHRNTSVDYLVRVGSLLGLSFPAFVLAILLLLAFAIQLRWFPVISAGRLDDPIERLRSLVLPAV